MKRIILSITLALMTCRVQPVTRKALEKAHTVTGIVSAVSVPAAEIIVEKMVKELNLEVVDEYGSGNPGRAQAIDRKFINSSPKRALIHSIPALLGTSHAIIGSALEKDSALIVRLSYYIRQIINAKHSEPAHVQILVDNLMALPVFDDQERMRQGTNISQARVDYLTAKENFYTTCSSQEAKAMAIELAGALTHEILRIGLYKNVAKYFEGPDRRISRRAIRALAHTVIIGLLELAKQKAAQQWSPDTVHIYEPLKTTIHTLVGMLITEISGEFLYAQMEEDNAQDNAQDAQDVQNITVTVENTAKA